MASALGASNRDKCIRRYQALKATFIIICFSQLNADR